MNSTWDKPFGSRWNWAIKAEAEFKQSLNKLDVDETLAVQNADEVTIGVYGPTQVGKTTLILRLLGISQESIGIISRWLRGKQKYGYSATVSTTQYRRSGNALFSLKSPEEKWKRNLTGDQLEQALADVRQQVAGTGEISTDSVIIEIANIYFEEGDITSLNIIDLPGVQSADRTEQQQVRRCVERWMMQCELTLLVDDATQLTAFTQIDDLNVKDWMNDLDQFRLVPTHALTLESVLTKLEKEVSKEKLRCCYAEELAAQLDGRLDTKSIESILYPIDIGDTLQDMGKTNKELYEKVFPMMEEIIKDLRMNLLSQKPKVIYFKKLASLYKVAEQKKHEDLRKTMDKCKEVQIEINRQEDLLHYLKKKVDKEKADRARSNEIFDEAMNDACECVDSIQSYEWDDTLNQMFNSVLGDKKASSLNKQASAFRHDLEMAVGQNVSKLKKSGYQVLQDAEFHFPAVSNTIEFVEETFDRYIFKKNYWNKWDSLKESTENWAKDYMKTALNFSNGVLSLMERKIFEENLKNSTKLQRLEIEGRGIQQKADGLQNQLSELEQQMISDEQKWQEDVENCQSLLFYFQKNALSYYHLLQKALINGTQMEKWQAQHLLFLLRKDSEMVIGYLTGKEKDDGTNGKGKSQQGIFKSNERASGII